MPFIEAPTTFYLGRRYDPETQRLADEVIYYDSRDLTTHAVVVGMTGSGKTGMCIALLEEAVLDGVPAIVIDPKGDITNLLLNFPELRPEDFRPWVNPSDAQRAGLGIDEYAAEVAQQWREGLASWGISSARMAAAKNAAQYTIYTPGSDAGLPISILASFQAPRDGWEGNEEFHREQISGIVTALMALIGRQVEPVKDREHVLISNIFEEAWRRGEDLSLEEIILRVQNPPFSRLGVFDVNTFFPERDRFRLAKELNHIIAAPSFQTWISGEPLDMRRLLYTPEGRPRVAIFYLAHLTDNERMFMITLILENVLAWMRSLSGTTSLRAILYFDEVFGHIPPAPHNPPTKEPLLRLLKTARAFGIGLVLATQNPGDLDYKGLSNTGTWFIGKLQTENDKRRVLGGLESAATAGTKLDIATLDRLISGLAPRVFVLHNVHNSGGPLLVHSRWAMSYLRGPLTRQQVRILMEAQRQSLRRQPEPPRLAPPAPPALSNSVNLTASAAASAPAPAQQRSAAPPTLPDERPRRAPPPTLPDERPRSTSPS
ncbi:MAG: ATP-binding protein, partial [Chloroflexi bacterium]|nr:ATP-binding protein [Chloroflexota bacterium]